MQNAKSTIANGKFESLTELTGNRQPPTANRAPRTYQPRQVARANAMAISVLVVRFQITLPPMAGIGTACSGLLNAHRTAGTISADGSTAIRAIGGRTRIATAA